MQQTGAQFGDGVDFCLLLILPDCMYTRKTAESEERMKEKGSLLRQGLGGQGSQCLRGRWSNFIPSAPLTVGLESLVCTRNWPQAARDFGQLARLLVAVFAADKTTSTRGDLCIVATFATERWLRRAKSRL